MNRINTHILDRLDVDMDAGQRSRVSVLAVGESDEWTQQGHSLPRETGVVLVPFEGVTDAALKAYQPDVIYSPVLARSFDCIDLAQLLHSLEYRGSYRAVASDLPKPSVIEREIKHICPRLDFSIVATD